MSWMNADADDIEASMAVVAKRGDADPSRMIAIGGSAGGAASLALAARNPPGSAVINLAGGEHWAGCAAVRDSIPIDFRNFGTRSHIPNLWVFAKNDLNHPLDQIEVMRSAFVGAGADLKLVLLEPIGEDGHTGLYSIAGRVQWLAELDSFLRAHNLPTWPIANVDVMLQKLQWPASLRSYVQAYLAAPGEKAFARTPGTESILPDRAYPRRRAQACFGCLPAKGRALHDRDGRRSLDRLAVSEFQGSLTGDGVHGLFLPGADTSSSGLVSGW